MLDIFYLDKEVKKAELKDLEKIKKFPLWIDVTALTEQEASELSKAFDLHPLTTEDLVHANTRVKIEEFPNYLLCVFYGIKAHKEQIQMLDIDFVIGDNFVISNHQAEINSYEELKKHSQKIEQLLKKGSDFFFHKLLDLEIDNYLPVIEDLDDEILDLEEKVTKHPKPELLNKIMHIKRDLATIKKYVLPQREKIGFLTKGEHKYISKKAVPYFRDVQDHAIRVSDTVDNYRETVSNAFEVYMTAVSNNTNDVMKVLSMIATIALPLTVISGIYGTNFQHLPGSGEWQGFWIMIGIMLALSMTMLYFFRSKGWIFVKKG
jgi:magnesium transporter